MLNQKRLKIVFLKDNNEIMIIFPISDENMLLESNEHFLF